MRAARILSSRSIRRPGRPGHLSRNRGVDQPEGTARPHSPGPIFRESLGERPNVPVHRFFVPCYWKSRSWSFGPHWESRSWSSGPHWESRSWSSGPHWKSRSWSSRPHFFRFLVGNQVSRLNAICSSAQPKPAVLHLQSRGPGQQLLLFPTGLFRNAPKVDPPHCLSRTFEANALLTITSCYLRQICECCTKHKAFVMSYLITF